MHIMKVVALAGCAVLLASCSSLSQEECRLGDWHAIGFADGTRGKDNGRIEDHRKACAEVGVSPDLNAYLAGWERGLEHYCTPVNGYQEGLAGRGYGGVCPGWNEAAFMDAHHAGYEVYTVRERIRKLEDRSRSARREIDKIEKERDKVRSRTIASAADGESVRNDLIALDRKLERETGDRRAYDTEIELLKRDLARLQERHRNGLYD